jgi:hypothetical protein
MCGIVGIAGDISILALTQVFRDMMDVCQVRGRDSTGVIKVSREMTYDHAKMVGPPAWLLDTKMYSTRIEREGAAAVVGHCRAKTVGETSNKNAHPFDYPEEGIIGVHNGTLTNTHKLHGHAYNKVDSDILYGHLAKNGVDETFDRLEGAWACVWWDDNSRTLNFIRNDKRPLWFTWSKDKKMMFWASEPWMFNVVDRKLDLWDGGEDKKRFVELPPDTLWSFSINLKPAEGEAVLTMKAPRKIEKKQEESSWARGPWRRGGSGGREWNRMLPNYYGDYDDYDDDVEDLYPELKDKEKDKGGSVLNPFLKEVEKDPPDGTELSQEELQNSKLHSLPFLSSSPLNGRTHKQSSSKSKRSTLSLKQKNSKDSQPKTSEEQSGDIVKLRFDLQKKLNEPRVSFRNPAGMLFVTDVKTGREFSVRDFFKNTGGCCCFCKTTITDPSEIGEIFGDKSFICNTCIGRKKHVVSLGG